MSQPREVTSPASESAQLLLKHLPVAVARGNDAPALIAMCDPRGIELPNRNPPLKSEVFRLISDRGRVDTNDANDPRSSDDSVNRQR